METGKTLKSSSELEEENRHLLKSLQELSILNEIATAISSTLSLDRIIELIVNKCIKHLNVEQCSVMLCDYKNIGTPFYTIMRKADSTNIKHPYRFNEELTGWMLKNQQPLLINDLSNDTRFSLINSFKLHVNSMLSVPLLLKGKMIGIITVFNKKDENKFNLEDQRLLAIIAAQSAQVIENARLIEEEQSLFKIQEELRMAKEIQMNLLPAVIPDIKGYNIAAINLPAREVGGDYYDFIPINNDLLGFCIGDVSGKGLPAALLMGNLQATIRGQTIIDAPCRERIARANNLLFKSTDSTKFATLFYGILNINENKICYCNAGHNYPFLFKKGGSCIRLDKGGIILGCIPNASYIEVSLPFEEGDTLILYSDGITEAVNTNGEEYEEYKLEWLIRENLHEKSQQLVDKIIKSIREHSGNQLQTDDITLIVLKRQS